MAAWVGRKRRGTTGVLWWKPISAAGNGSSVMRCARKPTSVKQPKWHSLSTSSTACWRWDARATSASYETTRTRDHCVHRLIHATRSRGATSPWHDERVRRAANLAIDRNTINEALTLGF